MAGGWSWAEYLELQALMVPGEPPCELDPIERHARHGPPIELEVEGGRAVEACGSYAAYRRHRRNGEPACVPCRRAAAAYERHRRHQARYHG